MARITLAPKRVTRACDTAAAMMMTTATSR